MASETGEAGARVFKSMLDIEEKANITPEDSLEGIKAKLNILDRTGDLFIKWANRADQYKLDHGSLDAKFEKAMRDDIAKARVENVVPRPVPAQPPNSAVDYLRKNPHFREQFDQKYGPGSSDKILPRSLPANQT